MLILLLDPPYQNSKKIFGNSTNGSNTRNPHLHKAVLGVLEANHRPERCHMRAGRRLLSPVQVLTFRKWKFVEGFQNVSGEEQDYAREQGR